MVGIINRPDVNLEQLVEQLMVVTHRDEESDTSEQSVRQALTHPNPTTQQLLTSKPLIHRPESGLNPLVDAAAYLFSIMGKLKHIKSYKRLDKLHDELVREIKNFQETIEAYRHYKEYLAEYIHISCYVLCAALDDIIFHTPWGAKGKWDEYSLLVFFNKEQLSPESLLIILERLVCDPAIYIDMIEFIYICLNLGFKCHYNAFEFSHEQLEQIINSLYKRIRAHRGNFNKILSPNSIRPPRQSHINSKKMPSWLVIIIASSIFITFFAIGKYVVDHTLNQSDQRTTQKRN